MTNDTDRAAWPEFVYRLIEHYKWEPQWLAGSVPEFDARIRRQEVPLNFLFNILLRWLPPEGIQSMLAEFGLEEKSLTDGRLKVEYPWAPSFTQPDVRIECEDVRVFIEIKVDAPIKLAQVQQYLLLHATMDLTFGQKRPYVLFLTKRPFRNCWRPSGAAPSDAEVERFLREATTLALPAGLESVARDENVRARFELVKQQVVYGAATWNVLGNCLTAIKSSSPCGITPVIDDFLSDLERRGLWAAAIRPPIPSA